MNTPGQVQLTYQGGAFPVAQAGVFVGDWVTGLAGMLSAAIQAKFAYGAGGTSAQLYIQTSLDQGATPIDIASLPFATAAVTAAINLSALTPQTAAKTPQQQALASGTCVDGLLGDRLRAVLVVTGTYSGSTALNVTANLR